MQHSQEQQLGRPGTNHQVNYLVRNWGNYRAKFVLMIATKIQGTKGDWRAAPAGHGLYDKWSILVCNWIGYPCSLSLCLSFLQGRLCQQRYLLRKRDGQKLKKQNSPSSNPPNPKGGLHIYSHFFPLWHWRRRQGCLWCSVCYLGFLLLIVLDKTGGN